MTCSSSKTFKLVECLNITKDLINTQHMPLNAITYFIG
jgi:hypothetical protein